MLLYAYRGIDYQVRPLAQSAEKIFTVKPGANLGQIKLKGEGIKKLSRGKDGSLKQKTTAGNLELSAEAYSQGG